MKKQNWERALRRVRLMRTFVKINRIARMISGGAALLGILITAMNIVGLIKTIPGR